MESFNTTEIMEGEWTGLLDRKGEPIHEGDILYIFNGETHEPLYKGTVFYQVDDNLPQFNFLPDVENVENVDKSENLLQKEMNSSHDVVVMGSIYNGLTELSIEEEQPSNEPDKLDTEIFKYITNQMYDLYKKKNSDYGNSFTQTYKKLGKVSALTRILDKVNRLISLQNKSEDDFYFESEYDNFLDLANYTVMTLVEMEKEKWGKGKQ